MTTSHLLATDRQVSYLLSLANKKFGTNARYLSQVRRELGLSSFQLQRGLSRATASQLIDQLKG